ncbi:MAG TPA: nucleotidyltransferase family protein, partial [Verrucomicrobiae bacterium]|nr:nucleotidyltransferase family protein [Verrucomicrobiae bacterium]
QWANYRLAIEAARNAGIPFLLGGGFGLAVYAGRWRNTKDIDLYIQPRDREAMIAALSNVGFVDYYNEKPYDPGWIYRSTKDGIIVDVIWSMANRRAEVDELWFEYAPSVIIRDETMQMVPMEELLWCKLYILQRDHCDWTDAFNLIHANVAEMDWDRLLGRLGEDWPLLQAILTAYAWLCPGTAAKLPPALRRKLHIPATNPKAAPCREDRIKLLDSRRWFAPFQPKDKFLEV